MDLFNINITKPQLGVTEDKKLTFTMLVKFVNALCSNYLEKELKQELNQENKQIVKNLFKSKSLSQLLEPIMQDIYIQEVESNSIVECILLSIMPDYKLNRNQYLEYIRKELFSYIKKTDFDLNYKKLDWNRNDIYQYLEEKIINKYILQLIADYFYINLFVLDDETGHVTICGGNSCVPYKKYVCVLKDQDNYKLISHNNLFNILRNYKDLQILNVSNKKNIVSYTLEPTVESLSRYIEKEKPMGFEVKMLANKAKYYKELEEKKNYDKEVELELKRKEQEQNNLELKKAQDKKEQNKKEQDKKEQDKNSQLNSIELVETEHPQIDIEQENNNKIKTYSLSELKKLKVEELYEIATNLNITVEAKKTKTGKPVNKTKIVLIDEIISHY